MRAMSDAQDFDKMKQDIDRLSNNVEELAKALRSLASVVNQHNLALKISAEEQEHILDLLGSSKGPVIPMPASSKRDPNDKPN